MSIEEKAKAYDEAMDRAKDCLTNKKFKDLDDTPESLTTYIFPELRESEDDKIYKEIYSIVHHHYERRAGLLVSPRDRNEMLEKWEKAKSFLEKQKESHIPWYDYQKSKEAGYTIVPNEEYEQLIKQKEPKPTWSEEDIEKMVSARARKSGATNAEMQFYRQGIEDTIKSLRPQPKQEWSEEDKKMLDAMIDIVSGTFYEPLCPRKEMLTWLKSLRPQPKQEWSEEDEKIIDTIISVLGQYINYKTVSGSSSGYATPMYSKEIEFLNALRPSWKPSEDEERLINTAISFLKDFADKGYENAVECIDWLKSKLDGNTGK